MTAHDIQPSEGSLSTTRYRPDIQGLRAFAVVVVIAFHAGLPVPGGFVGVDVFFVISGFVITAMLHREWMTSGTIRFRRFYVRRFKRLTPALAVMVSVTVLLSVALLSPFGTQQTAAETAIGAMFLVANVVISATTGGYFDSAAEINPLLNTWSLSVEEQFYLLFPALLLLGWWLTCRRNSLLRVAPVAIVGTVAVVSFATALLNSYGMVGPRTEFLFGYYGPVSRAWEFAVGAILALISGRLSRMPRAVARLLGWGGATGLLVSLWAISEDTPFPGPWTLLPVLSTAAVLAAGLHPTDAGGAPSVSGLLAARPFTTVGDWSYSLYLWHWPLIVFAALVWPANHAAVFLAAVVSFAPAVASYRWVESPMRLRSTPPPYRLLSWIAAAVLIPSVLAVGLWLGANRYWGFTDLNGASSAAATWEALAENCIDLSTTRSVTSRVGAEGCSWNDRGQSPPVYLVGDSAAAQFVAGVRAASEAQGRPLRLISAAHCPLTTARRVNEVTGPETDAACTIHNHEAILRLLESTPGTVLIATSDRYWYMNDDRFTTSPDSRQFDPASSVSALEGGLVDVIGQLQSAGHKVVVVTPTVTFLGGRRQTQEQMPMFRLVSRGSALTVDRGSLEPGQREARATAARVAQVSGAALLDLTDWQCPQNQCPAFEEGVLLYADSAHLSQEASMLLRGRFEEILSQSRTSG